MKKKLVMFGMMFSLLIPYALADIVQTLNNVWWKILSVGNLSFLGLSDGNAVVALTRLLIGVVVFILMYVAIGFVGRAGEDGKDIAFFRAFKKGPSIALAGSIATITAVFLPAEVLLATGAGLGTIVGLALIGLPTIGVLYLITTFPEKLSDNSRSVYFLKAVLVAVLIWVLAAMKVHVSGVLA